MTYTVVLGALTEHARQVTVLADEMSTAVDNAQTRLPGDSLGEVGQPFTAMMDQLVAAGNRALQSGVKAMNATGAGVRHSVNMLGQRESDNASSLGGIDV